MGHLTRLANEVVAAQEKGENVEAIKSLVSGMLLMAGYIMFLTIVSCWTYLLHFCLYLSLCKIRMLH